MGYTKKVISGFSLESGLKLATYALTVVKIYFLARILDPADFGLFSLTAIALGLSEALTQTGINLTIIQSKHSVKYFLDTAWVISILRGFLIGIIMILMGFGLSKYFTNPELLLLTSVAALIPVIKGFINPYIVILHKKMLYTQDVLLRFAIMSIEIISAILLGLWLQSAFALACAMIVSALVELLVSFLFFKQKPRFVYLKSRAKIIFDNARWLSLGSLLNYLVENIDDFLVGSLTNTHELGIYHNAYSMSHKTNYQLAKSVHYGTIPVYSKISDELSRLKRAFLKSLGVTAVIIALTSAPFLLFPQQIVQIFLGEKWLEVIPLLTPLILAGVVQSFSMLAYTLFLALKKYHIMNLHLFLNLILMIGLMIMLGRYQGLQGAVWGLLYARILTAPILIYSTIQIFQK
jgi:O-antigen/teichoic acid export membrane protein